MMKLKTLLTLLVKHTLAAYLQPVHDEYLSEYPPACNRRVEWLTGFSGSAGTAVVMRKKAAFFTDGRYTLQAKNEVDKHFERFNSGEKSPEAWLAAQVKRGDRIGYDPKLYTSGMLRRMEAILASKGAKLVPVANLVDAIWKDRPAAPASPVFVHEMKYAGESSADKRKRMAAKLKEKGADVAVIAAPDAVCWLLNIRGRDVPCTPLVLCNAILHASGKVDLYLDAERCDTYVRTHLGKGVKLCDPAKLAAHLKAFKKKRVLADPQSTPVWFAQKLGHVIEAENPCTLAKAIKNPVELQGMRSAHIRDGAAIVKLLCWLDNELPRRRLTEMDVSDKLFAFRKAHPMFVEPSFPTIAGSGPNGAIVHYRVSPESNRTLGENELFLLDSGGQYPDGTTDITRTVALGTPTVEQKENFTRVLKGHIAVALAQFPKGTAGSQLDALARQYLWDAGLDYDHGTGHGVGCFLSVHEGPQRISKRGGDAALAPGMIVSNEPGYYKEGEYGIRIENLVAVTPSRLASLGTLPPAGGGDKYLSFETITCAPMDTRLVEASMLTAPEKKWLNEYHAWVLQTLSPLLNEDERQSLKAACAAI